MPMSKESLSWLLFVKNTGYCSHKRLKYKAFYSSVTLKAFDEVKYLLDFFRNGISFQVSKPSCQRLNVEATENVYKADFGHL